ncbi:MAG: autotransporter-associated beta strand repeat-containing protein, partial [Planctomycetota bacterium]
MVVITRSKPARSWAVFCLKTVVLLFSIVSSANALGATLAGTTTVTYTAGAGINNSLTVSVSGANFVFADSAETITTSITGASGSGTNTVNIPFTGVTALVLNLGDGSDAIPALGISAYTSTRTITAASAATTTATITTSAAHNLCVGQSVTIAGVTPSGYNGTYTILSVPSTTTFTYTLAATQTAGTGFGQVTGPASLAVSIANTGTALTLTGSINVNGNVSVTAANALSVAGNILAGAGTIALTGNTDGAGTEAFSQTAGLLSTSNTTANALKITHNTASGGTGTVSIDNTNIGIGTTGGTLTVTSNGGSILYPGAAALTAGQIGLTNGGSSPTRVLIARAYVFASSGAASIGTTARPIQSAIPNSGGTVTLDAGSGGIFWTDWNQPWTLSRALAAGGDIRVVSANVGGHNLTIAGNVNTTNGGNIYLASDDNIAVNTGVTIGGTVSGNVFGGTVWMQANRDLGTAGQTFVFAGTASIVTTNTTSDTTKATPNRTPTTQAVYLDISGDAGTPSVLTVGNITCGNGGLIVIDASPHAANTTVTSGPEAGAISQLTGTAINAGATGTVMLNGVITANAVADAIGTAALPVNVTAGNVIATTNLGNMYIQNSIACNVSAAVTQVAASQAVIANGPAINVTTTTGAITVVSAANSLVATTIISPAAISLYSVAGGAVNLTGAGGVILNTPIGSNGTGAIGVSGPLSGSGNIVNAGLITITQATDSTYAGVITSPSGLTKAGAGNLTLSGTGNAYLGTTSITGGNLILTGTESGTIDVTTTGTSVFYGTGSLTSNQFSAAFSPGTGPSTTGVLSTGSLTLTTAANFIVDINGAAAAGTNYDQVNVTGAVSITNATLTATLGGGYIPALNDIITIIQNDDTDAVTGQFAGLPEGSYKSFSGQFFRISYVGGSGNDVTLTRQDPPIYYVDDNWAAFTVGQAIADADPVAVGNQPAVFGTNAFASVTTAIATVPQNGIIIVNAGTYTEAVVITKSITLTLQEGAISFNSLADTVNTAVVTLNGITLSTGGDTSSTTLGSSMTGAGTLNKVGSGMMTLGSAGVSNSYSGGTTVSGGVLAAAAALAFGNNAPTTLATGATLQLAGFNQTLGNLTGSGVIDNNSATPSNVTVTATANFTFAGNITQSSTGAINLTLTGGFVQTFSGLANHTGTTSILNGTFQAGSTTAFSNNSAITVASGATLSLNGFNNSIGSLTGTGSVTNGSANAATLTLGADGTTTIYTGIIQNGSTGTLAITKTGSGTFNANALNTYTGGTTVSQGTLMSNIATGFGTSTVTLGNANTSTNNVACLSSVNGITFANNFTVSSQGSGTATIGTNAGIVGATNTQWNGTITLNRDVILQAGSADRSTFTGQITGVGSITTTATLPAQRICFARAVVPANNYTGNLTLGAGSIVQLGVGSLIGNFDIPDTCSITFTSSSSELRLTPTAAAGLTDVETVNALISAAPGAGIITKTTGAGGMILTVGAGNGSGSFSGVISNASGNLSIIKDGTGTQTLSGASTYSPATAGAVNTTVTGGTLLVNNGSGSGVGTGALSVGSAGTLGGSGIISGAVSSSGTIIPAGTGAIGVISTGNLSFSTGAVLTVELQNGANDAISSLGTVNLANCNLKILDRGGNVFGNTFTIVLGTSVPTGNFANVAFGSTLTAANNPLNTYTVSLSGNTVVLTLTSITASASLDVTSGVVSYNAAGFTSSNMTVSNDGTTYTVLDTAGSIALTTNATAAGWTVNGNGSVSGPMAGVTNLMLNLGDTTDQIQALAAGSANVTINGADTLNLAGAVTTSGNLTIQNFTNLGVQSTVSAAVINANLSGTLSSTNTGMLSGTSGSLMAPLGIGSIGNPVYTQIPTLTPTAGAGNLVINIANQTGTTLAATSTTGNGTVTVVNTAGNLTLSGITTMNGNISVTNTGTGDLSVSGAITTTNANATISSNSNLNVNANINVGPNTMLLQANQSGTGTASFTQAQTGSTLTSTNNTAAAITIQVNTVVGGTGNASLRTISASAGTLSVNTFGGSILFAGTDTLDVQQSSGSTIFPGITGPAGSSSGLGGVGSAPTGVLAALNYVFSTLPGGTGSIGTATRPINTASPANNTQLFSAGSGGIYYIDFSGNPLTVNGATATGAGNIVIVAANGGGHNLTVAGNVSTGSGNIFLAADDDFTINTGVTVGGAGFSGTVYCACNRDIGNNLNVIVNGTITTSNTSTSAVVLEGNHSNGTAQGAIIINNVTCGDGGTITVSTAPFLNATSQGSIFAFGPSSVINAGPTGTVKLTATMMPSNTTYSTAIGTAIQPLTVTAGNVIISASSTTSTYTDHVYVTNTIGGNFTASTGSASPSGSLNLTTTSGILTIAGATNTGNNAALNLTGAGGVIINGVLNNSTTGPITINAGTNTAILNSTLMVNTNQTLTVTANGGLTLGSSGMLRGMGAPTNSFAVTTQANGAVAWPGSAINLVGTTATENMSVGALNLSTGKLNSILKYNGGGANVQSQRVTLTATSGTSLTLGSGSVLSFTQDLNTVTPQDYLIIDASANASGFTSTFGTIITATAVQMTLGTDYDVVYANGQADASPILQSTVGLGGTLTGAKTQVYIRMLNPTVTPVKIDAFKAKADGVGVHVTWSAISEFQNAGFNVYRRPVGETDWARVNSALIPGRIT